MSRYRKIYVKLWGDKKFRSLSSPDANGQTLWLFLLTGPQTTRIPGLFSSGEAGLAEIVGWSLEGFRKAFREAFLEGMVEADWDARLVWIPKAIYYNRPENPNVVKGWKDTWEEMPECTLKLKVFQQLKDYMKGLGEAFTKAFQEACQKPLANQEQEQEQELLPPSEGAAGTCRGPSSSGEVKQTGHPESKNSAPTRACSHPRLILFAEEYLQAMGRAYIVGSYEVEGGAAKRTVAKIPDESLYRQAVRAYLANNENRIRDNGHGYLWFVRELNRWTTKARGENHGSKNITKYDELYE
ncbi:MAG: hypothetical protein H7A32_04765 [Deltaproteobacteria bacterium]|nr:hypothetical protein [Deltaproteobacteria bacterium]